MEALSARLFWYGDDGPETRQRALRWSLRAAELGDPVAMNAVGVMSDDESVKERWWREGAALGEQAAIYNLANLLARRGDPTSMAEARQWVAHITDPENRAQFSLVQG